MKSLGICVGSSTLSFVTLEGDITSFSKIDTKTIFHNGDSKGELKRSLQSLDIKSYDRISITGKKLKDFVNLSKITEPEAIENAIEYLIDDKTKYNILISAGAETTLIYKLDKNGKISNVLTGNKCASGTGSFFLQQLGRMSMDIKDLKDSYLDIPNYEVSGRCSVFCKSDCTHALNKGTSKDSVVAGLCKMMAKKITELLTDFKTKNVIMCGGISKIKPITEYIKKEVDLLFIPEESAYIEAFGAAIWGLKNKTKEFFDFDSLFIEDKGSFSFLPPLKNFTHLVEFKNIEFNSPKDGDICILGVDVGSTTTKAILMRKEDNSILASVYLRTGGNPIKAAKECYKSILNQIGNAKVKIVGLGTTGSGRHIVGLHALTDSIYNEIICHATASIYFDKEVDTIFEIGGQDAKYTYITQGIPSDYAMNEACSAGTGSFIEESAKESLNVDVEDIAPIALNAKNPPNFSDQCAAFISSDIATALQEGISKEDIIAGLVYSICVNYTNRVKGARPYGKKIFMQGGVCYNKAIPVAMASLLNTNIIVPPEPGLMGAYGCALEIKKRLEKGLLEEKEFDLQKIVNREIEYLKPFICGGGVEKCDLKCEINLLSIEGKKFPFGGACNKYYNIVHHIVDHSKEYDLVALRERLLFKEYAKPSGNAKDDAKIIGINRTFLTYLFYPLYFHFWDQLGFKVVLSESPTKEGIEKKKAAFCYPAELSHGLFDDLLNKNVDYIFMPHILHIIVDGSEVNNKACVFVQGEPYYLKNAFSDRNMPPILTPIIDFQGHSNSVKKEFVKIAKSIGVDPKKASKAFDFAESMMIKFRKECFEIGKRVIKELEKNKDEFAIVLMGRWYNALAKEANMGIPHKFASRGITVIPYDFIPFGYEDIKFHMHWGIGKIILQVGKVVARHPQLFATYITNFSCGPDSFLVPHFRDEMGKKPSLTLELDSHTADVGLNTRIEAAIDIIKYYRQLKLNNEKESNDFRPAKIIYKGAKTLYIDSDGNTYSLKDPRITFLFPRMGRFTTETGVAAVRGQGYNAKIANIPDMDVLSHGKAFSSCKECVPYIICLGSILEYLKKNKKEGEKIAYFTVGDVSPCRVEQYQVGMKKLVEKNKIKDVAIVTLSAEESYAGLGLKALIETLKAFCVADVLRQIYSVIITLAENKEESLKIFNKEWEKIKQNFEKRENIPLYKRLRLSAMELSKIKLKKSINESYKVIVVGEFYVRNEEFSRQWIEEKLAEMGLVTKIVPMIEWLNYVDWTKWKNLGGEKISIFKRFYFLIKRNIQYSIEKKIKNIFEKSGLYVPDPINIKEILKTAKPLVDNRLLGEVGLTVGSSLKSILDESCGVISLSPFSCLQARTSDAILNNNMSVEKRMKVAKKTVFGDKINKLDPDMALPFLSIESDGNPFPQITLAKLDVFALQAKRLGALMNKAKRDNND